MRKPKNHSNTSRCRSGVVNFPANNALPANSEVIITIIPIPGTLRGGEVVVVSPYDSTNIPPNFAFTGVVSTGGAIQLRLIHSGAAPLNMPALPVRYMVLPT
jgi:hypothetical protein